MRKLPFFLLAAIAMPAAAALAVSGSDSPLGGAFGNLPMQSPSQTSKPAPDRIVKFYGMSFTDTASWSCAQSTLSGPGAAQSLPAVQLSNCISCTNQGSGSGDIVVDRPPDGVQETIAAPSGAEVQICGDVLALRGTSSSAGSTATTGSSSSSSGAFGGAGSAFGPAASGGGSGAAIGGSGSASGTGTTGGAAEGASGGGTGNTATGSGTGGTATASGTGSSGTTSSSAFGPVQQ